MKRKPPVAPAQSRSKAKTDVATTEPGAEPPVKKAPKAGPKPATAKSATKKPPVKANRATRAAVARRRPAPAPAPAPARAPEPESDSEPATAAMPEPATAAAPAPEPWVPAQPAAHEQPAHDAAEAAPATATYRPFDGAMAQSTRSVSPTRQTVRASRALPIGLIFMVVSVALIVGLFFLLGIFKKQ